MWCYRWPPPGSELPGRCARPQEPRNTSRSARGCWQAARRGVDLPPDQGGRIGKRDRVAGVRRLGAGERGAVGDDVLQSERVRRVRLRVEDVLELAVA